MGHRLIAQIAVDNLSSKAKSLYQLDNQAVDKSYASKSLVAASPWLDSLRNQENASWLSPLHYINLPYSPDGIPCNTLNNKNAVTAMIEAIHYLKSHPSTSQERGLQLRILLHVVGDVHQPLHAISRCSLKHPKGDRGATAFHLGKNHIAWSLHGLWDKGGGFLKARKSGLSLKKKARQIEKKYPCEKNASLDPEFWAQESFQIAVDVAYQTPEGKNPDPWYRHKMRNIVEKRLAVAGCRLAAVLNGLVDNQGSLT